MIDTGASLAFLQQVFGAADRGYFLIWTLPDKESYWFPAGTISESPDLLTGLIASLAPDHDVYVGCSIFPEDYGGKQRGKSQQATGIPGFWLDLDIAGPGHAGEKVYPPTVEDALSLLDGLPQPTMVIHSGHGLQCWWLFREIWWFDDEAERQKAAGMAVLWQKTIQERARLQGWTVDSTADLSRVLRLPGTLNHKPEV